jgi:hypothetical protein
MARDARYAEAGRRAPAFAGAAGVRVRRCVVGGSGRAAMPPMRRAMRRSGASAPPLAVHSATRSASSGALAVAAVACAERAP